MCGSCLGIIFYTNTIFGFNFLHLCSHRQLVSSYKGKFGYVQYYVQALMERPQQPKLECKKFFEVEEPLDVNTPDLLVSSLTQNNTNFSYSGSHCPNNCC